VTHFFPLGRFGLALLALACGAAMGFAQPANDPLPEDAALAEPAAAPPDPAALPALYGPPSAPAEAAPAALPPGMEVRPEGRWRVRFAGDTPHLTVPAAAALATLGRRLAALPEGRITVEAQASGPAADVSIARRLSLERGLAVKQALAEGGLAPTRIDIRPLGRTGEAVDAADVLPPPAARAASAPTQPVTR
jgi:outer membrane protein OmpA-like peptidoglycan-associated protein